MSEKDDEQFYAAKIPLETLGHIIGSYIPENKDPYEDFEDERSAAEYGDQKKSMIENLNWVLKD